MRPLMITGISGFIGGHLWAELAFGDNILGIAGSSGKVALEPTKQIVADLSVPTEIQEVIKKHNPRCIIHLAAVSNPAFCEKNSLTSWKINHVATRRIAETAHDIGARMIFASSDQVFDGIAGNYNESSAPSPLNTYGETKRAAELALFNTLEDLVVIRFNNVFGKVKFRGGSFSEWILSREELEEPITLFTNQVRSFIDVHTVTSVLMELIDNSFKGLLHVGGRNPLTRVEFGRLLLKHLGKDTSNIMEMHSTKKDPKGFQPANNSFDISRALKVLETDIPCIEESIYNAYGPGVSQFRGYVAG